MEPVKGHDCPHQNCYCGFNMRSRPVSSAADVGSTWGLMASTDQVLILGACLNWGRLIFHGDHGFRAENARAVLLAYDPKWPKGQIGMVKGIAEDYDCRVVPVSFNHLEASVSKPDHRGLEQFLDAATEYGRLVELKSEKKMRRRMLGK